MRFDARLAKHKPNTAGSVSWVLVKEFKSDFHSRDL